MAKYNVSRRESPPPKRKWSFGSIAARAAPGVIGLALVGFGLLEIVAIHAGGQNANSRGGVCPTGGGVVLLAFWAFSNRSDGYNF